MTDFNEPTNTSLYSGVLGTLRALIASCAKMDYSSDTNVPVGAIRFNATDRLLESWSGSAWGAAWPLTQAWSPTYGGSGSMTFTGVDTKIAEYFRMGDWVFFNLRADGTTGGSASIWVTFTLPVAPAVAELYQFNSMVYDASFNTYSVSGSAFYVGSSVVNVANYSNSNWGLGSDRRIYVNGFYKAA